MTKRYTGGVISSSLPTVNAGGASGVFLLSQQADYQSRNSWPPFKVEESLRFRSSASAYLNRTFSAGNRKTFTFSAWVKRGSLTGNQNIFGPNTSTSGSGTYGVLRFVDGSIEFFDYTNGTYNAYFYTSSSQYTFRDPSAWYHLVLAVDTTQATGSDRIKVYVNGTQITGTFYTTPTQNVELQWNNNLTHYLGTAQIGGSNQYFDGYLAEVNFIDGQALTPSSFGATDKDGNWSPIAYTGTYGTNGFYVNFRDNTSATTMGYDYSGNGNNWTLNAFNVSTANTTYDIMIDVPEDQSDGTANNRGNYCVLNPVNVSGGGSTISNGNLSTTAGDSGTYGKVLGTFGMTTGKWYWEVTSIAVGTFSLIGIGDGTPATASYALGGVAGEIAYLNTGNKYTNSSSTAYGASYTTNDIIGVAYDADAGSITFYKNGASQGAVTGFSGTKYPALGGYSPTNPQYAANFGQRPFTYTPPSGFKSLNTYNLPEPTIKQPNQYFDALLYTGNGSSSQRTDISWTNIQPDMVWIKNRTTANNHVVHDVIRGPAYALQTNLSNATDGPVGFGSDGFGSDTGVANQLRVYTNDGRYNLNTNSYVAWGWKAAASNTTNTSGSITSIVRANQTAGFSIVTYTANATDPITVGHGLGVAPSMFIVKSRSAAGTDWFVYHSSLGATKNLRLNGTAAAATATNVWNDTAPTSSVITTSNAINTNNVTYVAYCFAAVAGYSAFGSYTGNGSSDGPFVYLGFKPKFILIRRSDIIAGWKIYNTSGLNYNPINTSLEPHDPGAEATSTNFNMDLLSNGFKLRTTYADFNTSGGNYIYAAFAETPFKYARSR